MKDKLLEFINRRHPLYERMAAHWKFVADTYEGGRPWFAENIFKFMKEGDQEYADRVKRAYRFNHTKQVVDLVDKYLFKMPVARKQEDAPAEIRDFWKRATLSGLDIDTLSKRISAATSKFGRVYVVVDTTANGGTFTSIAEARESNQRAYAYIVTPGDMLDMAYDELGEMQWCKIRECKRDDADPIESSGEFYDQYRLWTKDDWTLYEVIEERGKKRVIEVDYGVHGLGVVPVVQADHNFSEEPYESAGLCDDIAYLDRAVANYLSNLDAIIQDQTFSQLTLPAQGLMPGEEGYDALLRAGTKRAFIYNGESGKAPEYISPDPKQAGVILSTIVKIINEIYHSVGLAAARTKEDNGGGVDNASGVAKAYDFEGINALLAAKASSLEIVERKVCALVQRWNGVDRPDFDKLARLVTYSREFDVRGLYDEFEIAAQLLLLNPPDDVRREQMRSLIKKLFPMVSDETLKKLEESLKDWPPPPEVADPALGGKQNGGGPVKAAGAQKTAKSMTA